MGNVWKQRDPLKGQPIKYVQVKEYIDIKPKKKKKLQPN